MKALTVGDFIIVEVVKPFEATRTPCPPAGTKGELYDFDGEFACVRFPLPMKDTSGAKWLSHGQDDNYMKLKFKMDEIKSLDVL